MFKEKTRIFWKKLHNVFSIFGFASLCLGVAMFLTSIFIPLTEWSWVTKGFAQAMSIIGFIFFGLALFFLILGFIKTKTSDAVPSFNILLGLKNILWRLYQIERKASIQKGDLGLSDTKENEVLKQVRHDWNTQVKIINKPLSETETDDFINHISRKYGKTDSGFNKKILNQLFVLGVAIDKCHIGVSSILHNDTQYIKLNEHFKKDKLSVKNKKFEEIRSLSYSLNSILLAILYFKNRGKELSPNYKIPIDLFIEGLDYHMSKKLEAL
jgi:hypothetical protein